jgi:hypothetical protein
MKLFSLSLSFSHRAGEAVNISSRAPASLTAVDLCQMKLELSEALSNRALMDDVDGTHTERMSGPRIA